MTTALSEPDSSPAAVAPRADVLFVHIQKTAGMSLYNSMARWFGPEHSLRYARSSEEFKAQFLRLSDGEIDRFRLLSGHFELPFWLRRKLADRLVVSLVREPVERILSIYRYTKSWKDHRRHADVGQMSIAEFVDVHLGDPSRQNWQCRKFCGEGNFPAAKAMVEKHIDLLGSVESMGTLVTALGERLGVKLDIREDNRSTDPTPRRDDLDASLLARLQAGNAEDTKLWTWVIEKNLVRGHR